MWKILEVLRRVARGERPRALGLDVMSEVEEGHLRPRHVCMVISIPPKYAAVVVGYIERKSAIRSARRFGKRRRNLVGTTSEHGVTSCRRRVATKR